MAGTLQETIREDGLRVITKRIPYTKQVILSISALAGLADDHADKEGLMHFWEHMAFKGTVTKDRNTIKKILGQYTSNAYTDWLRTCYWVSAPYTCSDSVKSVLFDMYLNPALPVDEIEKEKEVVRNETAEFENNDYHKADFELNKLLWKYNPVRRVSCGTLEGLANITRDTLVENHKQWYGSSNTAIVAVGCVGHQDLVDSAFSTFPMSESSVARRAWDNEAGDNPYAKKSEIERKDRARGVVLWGCKVPKCSDKDKDVIKILDRMLGHGFDSMLFEEVRERRGYVYGTWSQFADIAGLASCMTFGAGMLSERISEVTDLICDVVCNNELDKDHFLRSKQGVFNELIISLETPFQWSHTINRKILDENCELKSLERYAAKRVKELNNVTFDEVLKMRAMLLKPERMACAIIRPV